MLPNDYRGKAVLITGGTKGLGLATGLAFGKVGADVYLTNKWGSANEDEIRKQFSEVGAPSPVILEADAGVESDTTAVMEKIRVHAKTPPAFLVHAADDRVDPLFSVRYFQALEEADIPAELHIYSEGGHGFGLLERGLPVSGWPLRLKDWMRRQQLIR